MVGSASSRGRNRRGSSRSRKRKRGGSPYTKLYSMVGAGVLAVGGLMGWLFLAPAHGETQGAACAVLVDRTGSSINQLTQASYVKLASHMVDGCRTFRASFSVYYFDNQDAKLQKASETPYALWRPATHRQSIGEEKVDAAKKEAVNAVQSVFRTDPAASHGGHGSDIVTALSLASQSLQQQAAVEGVDQKYLVVLTDGYQTGDLSMRKAFTSPDSSVKQLLKRTDQLGLVPQLSDTAVSFGGVGGGVASDKEQVPSWYEALVKSYWTQLVQDGGGQMCVYNVEPTYLPGVC